MTKLVWKRVPHGFDKYALVLTNPEAVDIAALQGVFTQVTECEGASRGRRLSTQASIALSRWLDDVTRPLASQAYGRLSNWFLTEKANDRESPLADACVVFWDALFMTRPPRRLTHTNANGEIVDAAFDAWWQAMEKRQGQQ
jgi:hypothetical protein